MLNGRPQRTTLAGSLATIVLTAAALASAQEAAAEAPTPAGEVAPEAPVSPTAESLTAPPAAPVTSPYETTAAPMAPMLVDHATPAELDAAMEDAVGEPDDDGLQLSAFADAYVAITRTRPGTPYASEPFHRAYVHKNGFSLSFLGLDASYDTDEFGMTGSLRYGPSVAIYHGAGGADTDGTAFGMQNLTQAYASWRPLPGLQLDLGQFGTIYGAEVAESWQNLNYTRGALYYAMQPFWHTGLKASYAATDELSLTGMVVNGVNSSVDDDGTPSAGVQLAYATDTFSVIGGYLHAVDGESDTSGFDRFIDVVATLNLGDFSAVANFDFNIDEDINDDAGNEHNASFWGASLALGYFFVPEFGVALRGELLEDTDGTIYGVEDSHLMTGTLTADIHPVPENDHLIIRWDNRLEKATGANNNPFVSRAGNPSDKWFISALGVVVTTD